MITFLTRLLLSTLLLCLACNACAARNELPFRSDCIVKVSLEPSDSINFRNGALDNLVSISSRLSIPLAGYKIKNKRIAYLQYSGQCDKKSLMSKALLSDIFTNRNFQISSEIIVPGPDTINMTGKYWQDTDIGRK